MVPERTLDGNSTKYRKNHGESKEWSTAERHKTICGLYVHVGFE